MEPLSAQNFIHFLANGTALQDIQVNEDIITNHIFSGGTVSHIKNCVLKSLKFPRINYQSFAIVDCTADQIIFENVSIKKLEISGCKIGRLIIKGNFHSNETTIKSNYFNQSISVLGSKIDQLNLHNNETKTIELENSNGKIELSGVNTSLLIDLILLKGNIPSISIKTLSANKIIHEANSPNCHLDSITINDQLLLNKGVCNELTIRKCKIRSIDIKNTTHTAKIFEGILDEVKFTNKQFTTLSTRRDDQLQENDCVIGTLDLSESSGLINLKSSEISVLKLNGFTASKGSKLHYLSIKDSLLIENSTLENCKFHNLNLSSATIKLLNSSLTDSDLINVEWPKRNELHEYNDELSNKRLREKLNILWPLKESYRQLKVLSLAQHNKIDALAFQKHELKTYWKIVDRKTRSSFRLRGSGTWLILFTNWIFSDFGQSLRRPIGWLFLFHSLFLYRLTISHNLGVEFQWNPELWDTEATKVGTGIFLNLLSPVHSTEIVNQYLHSPVSIFGITDFFMRLSSGYFIYYFIRATRKFNMNI